MADLYASITDDAINRAIAWLQTHVPYLFNYVAPAQVQAKDKNGNVIGFTERWLVCKQVTLAPDVPATPLINETDGDPEKGKPIPGTRGIPLYTRIDPLRFDKIPIPGVPCCLQITAAQFDFHPTDQIPTLPPQLNSPLAEQQFGVRLQASFGLACPPDWVVEMIIQSHLPLGQALGDRFNNVVMNADKLICFSLEVYVIGHLYVQEVQTQMPTSLRTYVPFRLENIRVAMDGLEIVDITPDGLESAAECYLSMAFRAWLLPLLTLQLGPILEKATGLVFTPILTAGLPHNPAVEDNELRVWLDITVE